MTEKPEVTKLNHRSQSKAQGHISKQEVIQSLRSQQTKWLGSKAEGHSAKPKVNQQSKRSHIKARGHKALKQEATKQSKRSHNKD